MFLLPLSTGADKKTSVLDYVVKSLYDRGEEKVLIVADDLAIVESAAPLSSTDLVKEMHDLQNLYDQLQNESLRIKQKQEKGEALSPKGGSTTPVNSPRAVMSSSAQFVAKLDERLHEFESTMGEVNKVKKLMERKSKEIIEYFAEDVNDCDTSNIFKVLTQFRNALTLSKEGLERRERSLQRAARAKSKSPSRKGLV